MKKDKNEDAENDPLAGLSDEEREIIEQIMDDLPEEMRQAINEGRGKFLVQRMDGTPNAYSEGLGKMVAALTTDMATALTEGKDPYQEGVKNGAVAITASFLQVMQMFPQQGDIIFKSIVYALSAHFQQSPKAMLEAMAEHAPENIPLTFDANIPVNHDDNDNKSPEKQKEIEELNALFNLDAADDPNNKEEK